MTIKEFFKVLCHYKIEHPIVRSSLLCYCNRLDLDYSELASLLISGSSDSEYAIYRFKKKLRDSFKSQKYRKRIVTGTCQVGRHPMVVLPSTRFPETFHLRWGVMLQCCGSICCRKCFDWIFSRRALALPNSTTCPICHVYLDVTTGEYLWEYTEVLESLDRYNQLRLNGLIDTRHFIPVPLRPLPQPNPPSK